MEPPKIDLELYRELFRVTNEMEKFTNSGYGTAREYANILTSTCRKFRDSPLLHDMEASLFWLKSELKTGTLKEDMDNVLQRIGSYTAFVSVETRMLLGMGLDRAVVDEFSNAALFLKDEVRTEDYDADAFLNATIQYRDAVCEAANGLINRLEAKDIWRKRKRYFLKGLATLVAVGDVGWAGVFGSIAHLPPTAVVGSSIVLSGAMALWVPEKADAAADAPRWLRND